MSKLKIGIIGTGSIGNAHMEGFAECKDLGKIHAICDLTPARLNEMGEKFGVPAERRYSDYKEMIAKEKLDCVSVCTWNCYHFEIAAACMEAGIPTLCEKPMTIDIDDARKLRDLARKTGVKNMVAFSHRFGPHNIAVKQLLDNNAIGQPFMIRIRFAHGGPYPGWAQSDWFYDPKRAGYGALMDMGIHALDLMKFFIGDIEKVTAMMATLRKDIKVEDNALVLCDFGAEKKCMGYLECGWTTKPGFTGIEIYGDEGTIIINNITGENELIHGVVDPSYNVNIVRDKIELPDLPGGWMVQPRAWLEYLAGVEKKTYPYPIPTFEEGFNSVVVGLKSVEAAQSGIAQSTKID